MIFNVYCFCAAKMNMRNFLCFYYTYIACHVFCLDFHAACAGCHTWTCTPPHAPSNGFILRKSAEAQRKHISSNHHVTTGNVITDFKMICKQLSYVWVRELSALLGSYAACIDDGLPTFRENLSVSFWSVKRTCLTVPMCFPETSVT
jgi:hypothetical protein